MSHTTSNHEATQRQLRKRIVPWSSLSALVIAAGLAFTQPLHTIAQTVWGQQLDGSNVTQLTPSSSRLLVLFFVASDCPISDRTFPEMKRLRERYALHGVTFWYVYPNDNETVQTVSEHQRSFDPQGTAMLAHAPDIVRLAHVYATPEIAVLQRDSYGQWQPIYAGRIDDRYVKFGLERPKATQHFGDDAIAAALQGHPPRPATGSIVGCAIMNPGARP